MLSRVVARRKPFGSLTVHLLKLPAQSKAGGILRTLKGTAEVWGESAQLQAQMTYVYAEDVSFKNGAVY
jgi:hypothetical protein